MDEAIEEYVRSCPTCQKDKASRHKPYGFLSPLELPYASWQSISMDFITDVPESDGCDQLWVIVDRFTKMAHFIPLAKDNKQAEDLAKIFAREIWRYHGIPSDIVSDRDSRFTSNFWRQFLEILSITMKPRMSTAFHPRTDGQTERTNQFIETYLRGFFNNEQDDWVELLPTAEFAYNNAISASTGVSPFFTNYGFNPASTDPPTTGKVQTSDRPYANYLLLPVHADVCGRREQAQERM